MFTFVNTGVFFLDHFQILFGHFCWPGSRQNINFVSSAMKEKINISTSRYFFHLCPNQAGFYWQEKTYDATSGVVVFMKQLWRHWVSVLSGCSDLIDWSFFTAEILELHDILSNLLALVIWPRVFQYRTTGSNSEDIVMKVVENSTIFQISQKKMLKNVAFSRL